MSEPLLIEMGIGWVRDPNKPNGLLSAETRDYVAEIQRSRTEIERLRNLYVKHTDIADTAYQILQGENEQLRAALTRFLEMYISCVQSGDWGFWDPEKDDEVIAARAALALSQAHKGSEP